MDFAGRHQGNATRPEQYCLAVRALALNPFGHEPDVIVKMVMPAEIERLETPSAKNESRKLDEPFVLHAIAHFKSRSHYCGRFKGSHQTRAVEACEVFSGAARRVYVSSQAAGLTRY